MLYVVVSVVSLREGGWCSRRETAIQRSFYTPSTIRTVKTWDPIKHGLQDEILATTDTWPDQTVKDKHLLVQVSLSLFLRYHASYLGYQQRTYL
jgi:hypothetical protein